MKKLQESTAGNRDPNSPKGLTYFPHCAQTAELLVTDFTMRLNCFSYTSIIIEILLFSFQGNPNVPPPGRALELNTFHLPTECILPVILISKSVIMDTH